MCINASTDKWYTSNDFSYILVSVPKQEYKSNYVFFFQLNSNKNIGIPMVSGVNFLSLMKLLTHRQQCIAGRDASLDPPIIDGPGWQSRGSQVSSQITNTSLEIVPGNNFVNVCSYPNRRVLTYIRASMNRNKESNK